MTSTKLETTTRGSNIGVYLPDKKALLACFALATTPESADYMVKQLTALFQKTKMLSSGADILQTAEDYRQNVHLQRDSRANPWLGNVKVNTDFQNLQQNLAKSAIKTVAEHVNQSIKMDIAINEQTQMLRGFSTDNQPATPEIAQVLDKLFNAWLAEHNLICKGSVIYEGTPEGDIQVDKAGNLIKANTERVRALIADKTQGFERYFAGFVNYFNNKNLSLAVQQHAYPQQPQPVSTAREQPTPPTSPVRAPSTPAQSVEPEIIPVIRGNMGG